MRSTPYMIYYLDAFVRELRNRGYAPNSIKAYGSSLERFLDFRAKTAFEPAERISRFLTGHDSQEERRIAWNAIKLFYELVLGKPCPYTMQKIRQDTGFLLSWTDLTSCFFSPRSVIRSTA
jgi:hypothetical protein